MLAGKYLVLIVPFFLGVSCFAQEQVLYKEIDSTRLFLEIYYPESMDKAKEYPAIIFFFGGGFTGGDKKQFSDHAKYFAKRGLVCFLVDYRIKSKHNTTPFESLKDAKSAIRFIRENASDLKVNPSKIIGSGGSAGGHLAAATAFIEKYNESTDDLTISSIPNALVLFNPVVDNGPDGWGYNRIGDAYKHFSPIHNIRHKAPPTIFFLGTKDHLIPVKTALDYQKVMDKVGSRCELKLYEGEGHGFFNYQHFDNYKQTVLETDQFLQSLGYLQEKSVVDIDSL
jgi:acetyl esterase